MLGQKVNTPSGLDLARRASREGHWIGNHTWSHSLPLGLMQPEAAKSEFDRTQATIGTLVDPRRLFRPYGQGGNLDHRLLSRPLVEHLSERQVTIVLWSALPRDWQDPDGWVERALDQCAVMPWSLMVLHDLPTGAMRHLERFLDRAIAAGARFRQAFPPDCLPMVDGEMRFEIDNYISTSS